MPAASVAAAGARPLSHHDERRQRRLIALRSLARVLAVVCSLTAVGSLLVCLFARPEAWFMVIIWAGLAWAAAHASRGA